MWWAHPRPGKGCLDKLFTPLKDVWWPPLHPHLWPAFAATPTMLRQQRAMRRAQLPKCLKKEWFDLHEWP